MEIIVGKTSGFCAGVKNAVQKVEQELENKNQEIYCLGELVHNKQVIEKLEQKGLIFIDNIDKKHKKVIIRAHGIPKEIYEKAKKENIELLDFTCPKVLQIHKIAEQYEKENYCIILIGIKNHPEVIGTISFCGKNSYIIEDFSNIDDCIKNVEKYQKNNILIIAQTTFSLEKFNKIVEELENRLEYKYNIEVKNTICYSTKTRQEETEQLSKKVEYMIIVGGKNSSNTKKLYEIAEKNCANSILVETVEELPLDEIKKYNKIGIMAGASTPIESVETIIKKLKGE